MPPVPKPPKKTKIKVTKKKSLKKICDELWFELVKTRAGFKSELSGRNDEYVAGHHIAGKSNYRLRYEPKNGICLLYRSEHTYGVHSHDPLIADSYMNRIIALIGLDTWNWLKSLKNCKEKQDLRLIKIYLENEIAKLKPF